MSRAARAVLLLAAIAVLAFAAAAQSAQPAPNYEVARITQGPNIQYVDDELAVLTWSTDVATENRVFYGTDPNNLTNIAEAPNRLKVHRVNLTNLKPGTTYYFQIDVGQMTPTNNEPMASFQTVARGAAPLQNQQPHAMTAQVTVTRGPVIQYADESSAVIAWTTSAATGSTLLYGTDPARLSLTADEPGQTTTHRVHLLHLAPNTVHYFQVAMPNRTYAPVSTFRTVAVGAAPLYEQQAQTAQGTAPSPVPPQKVPPVTRDEGFSKRLPGAAGPGLEVPAGTEIDGKLETALSSKTSKVGDKFTATITQPIRASNGAVAIPAGSRINGEVTEAEEGRTLPTVRGRGKLNMKFTDIVLPNGASVALTASLLSLHDRQANEEGQVQSSTKGGTVAKDVGIGAGIGTVAGLLFGSALKGLLIGAVAGGGYVLATGGKNVEIPAQAGIKLRLDHNITVPTTAPNRSELLRPAFAAAGGNS